MAGFNGLRGGSRGAAWQELGTKSPYRERPVVSNVMLSIRNFVVVSVTKLPAGKRPVAIDV